MGNQTDFTALTNGQQAASNTCAGLRADVAYWRRMSDQRFEALVHLEACRQEEVADRDRQISSAARCINEQAAHVGRLMAQVSNLSDQAKPGKLAEGLRRCDARHEGVDLTADYDVLLASDGVGTDCESAAVVTVWHAGADITHLLSATAFAAIEEQCQTALDDWLADDAQERAEAAAEDHQPRG